MTSPPLGRYVPPHAAPPISRDRHAAPRRGPRPRARSPVGVAGATAGPDAARSASGPQWAITSPPEAGRAPGAHHRVALPDHPDAHGWPSLSGQTSAPLAPPRASGGASASTFDCSIRIAALACPVPAHVSACPPELLRDETQEEDGATRRGGRG